MSEAPPPTVCPNCNTALAPGLLSCPGCQRLLHADTLKQVAADAQEAEAQGRQVEALGLWRSALELLPVKSRQYASVSDKVSTLSENIDTHPDLTDQGGRRAAARPVWVRSGLALGGLGLLLWKFKFVVAFVATKGKLLLMGLTKASTLFSMLLSFGLYWTVWGWRFALGLVLSIYVHEMGHIAALRRFGIRASAPAFIPGLGAFIRMKQHPTGPVEDARVGLAGPIWGLVAAAATYGLFLATGWAGLSAIARVAAWINLFNLLPISPLDGGRGFRAMNTRQRWSAVAGLGVMWFYTGEGLLILLLLAALFRAFGKQAPEGGDDKTLLQYTVLVVLLSVMCTIEVPLPEVETAP